MSVVAVAVAVVRCGEKFLIGRRPDGVPLAGLWEFPGGKVRPGETPEEAAVRECREETGLDVVVVARLDAADATYDHGRVRIDFFLCSLRADAATARSGYRWASAEELPRYEFPRANARLIALLAAGAAPAEKPL